MRSSSSCILLVVASYFLFPFPTAGPAFAQMEVTATTGTATTSVTTGGTVATNAANTGGATTGATQGGGGSVGITSTVTTDGGMKEDGTDSSATPGEDSTQFKVFTSLLELLKDIKWALLLTGLLLVLRQPIRQLVSNLSTRFETSNIDIQVQAKSLQIKLEGPVEPAGRVTVSLPASALELPMAPSDAASLAKLVEPHTILVRKAGVKEWITQPGQRQLLEGLEEALTELKRASADQQKSKLVDYLRKLEQCRFYEADKLLEYVNEQTRQKVEDELGRDPDSGSLLRWGLGFAHTLRGEWSKGLEELQPLMEAQPPLLPAVDVFLCCRYNQCAHDIKFHHQKNPDRVVESLREECVRLDDFPRNEWRLPELASPENEGFYKAEFTSTLGSVYASIAECGPPSSREGLLQRAEPLLRSCARQQPQSRDFNNYADVLRQLGKPQEALLEIEKALCGHEKDPTYLATKSRVLFALKRPRESLDTLARYGVDDAERDCVNSKRNVYQYILNQVLHARVLFAWMNSTELGSNRLAVNDPQAVIGVLKDVAAFMDRHQNLWPSSGHDSDPAHDTHSDREDLDKAVYDALGDAYLQALWQVDEARNAFAHLDQYADKEPLEVRLRRRIAVAKGHLRLAQLERERFNHHAASEQRSAAEGLLVEIDNELGERVEALRVSGAGELRQSVRALLKLDLLEANQDLASQCFHQERFDVARRLSEQRIRTLMSALTPEADPEITSVGRALGDRFEGRKNRARARDEYLQGRLAVQSCSKFDHGTVEAIKEHFVRAQAIDMGFRIRVHVSLGHFLLKAALEGDGDVQVWYREALERFQSVLAAENVNLRREGARLVAEAIALKPSVQRRSERLARESK